MVRPDGELMTGSQDQVLVGVSMRRLFDAPGRRNDWQVLDAHWTLHSGISCRDALRQADGPPPREVDYRATRSPGTAHPVAYCPLPADQSPARVPIAASRQVHTLTHVTDSRGCASDVWVASQSEQSSIAVMSNAEKASLYRPKGRCVLCLWPRSITPRPSRPPHSCTTLGRNTDRSRPR